MPLPSGAPRPRAKEQLVLLLGDIHANEAALAAVLDDVYSRYPGRKPAVWFLGDLVGRGPRPVAAYQRLMATKPEAIILGNHEGGLVGIYENVRNGNISSGNFHSTDWNVLLHHRQELHSRLMLECENGRVTGGEMVEAISRWPIICAPRPSIYMVHGGLDIPFVPPSRNRLDPFLDRLVWDYVKGPDHAEYTRQAISWVAANRPDHPSIALSPGEPAEPRLIVVGHWHTRLLHEFDTGQWHNPVQLDTPYPLEGRTTLLSPGSVGFPRQTSDLDASYCVLRIRDGQPYQVVFHKRAYDRLAVRNEMAQKGYPETTIKRLRLPGDTETARPGAIVYPSGCGPEEG